MTSRIGDRTKTMDEAVFVVVDVDKETYQKRLTGCPNREGRSRRDAGKQSRGKQSREKRCVNIVTDDAGKNIEKRGIKREREDRRTPKDGERDSEAKNGRL